MRRYVVDTEMADEKGGEEEGHQYAIGLTFLFRGADYMTKGERWHQVLIADGGSQLGERIADGPNGQYAGFTISTEKAAPPTTSLVFEFVYLSYPCRWLGYAALTLFEVGSEHVLKVVARAESAKGSAVWQLPFSLVTSRRPLMCRRENAWSVLKAQSGATAERLTEGYAAGEKRPSHWQHISRLHLLPLRIRYRV